MFLNFEDKHILKHHKRGKKNSKFHAKILLEYGGHERG